MHKNTGFTLIELMSTMAIVAILLSFGVPGFQNILRNNQLATDANRFIGSLNLARSEAIKRGTRVEIKANNSDGKNWQDGWLINVITPITKVNEIKIFDNSTNIANSAGLDQIIYLTNGFVSAATEPVMYVCNKKRTAPERGRKITISLSGRPKITDYTCP